MVARIIPRLIRGRLWFQVSDVLFPTFAAAAAAWSAAECHRLDIVEVPGAHAGHLIEARRCDDCELNLGTSPGVTLRAAFACPRFGKPRAGVESRCASFVRKAGGAQ